MKELLPADPLGTMADRDNSATLGGGEQGGGDGKGRGSNFDSVGFEEYAPMIPFFEALWNRIDSAVGYPDDFVNQRISGTVSFRISIDKTGALTDDRFEVHSDNSYLEAYVVAVLLHTLKDPLNEKYWVRRKAIPLNLIFDFETTSDYGVQQRNPGNHVRNALLFNRRAYVEPIINETIERILTKYIPPIIPIPGGFFIDFVHLYRMIASFNQPDERDRRNSRIRMLRQNLDQVIKKDYLQSK